MKAMILAGLAALAPLSVAALELDLPGEESRTTATYNCDDGQVLETEFIQIGENSLAVVVIEGTPWVMAQVVSADGARYVAGFYEFWSRGDEATFSDARIDREVPLSCKAE